MRSRKNVGGNVEIILQCNKVTNFASVLSSEILNLSNLAFIIADLEGRLQDVVDKDTSVSPFQNWIKKCMVKSVSQLGFS